MIITL